MHRVVRMQRPAHAGTANGKHRWPSLDEKSRRNGRQRHVHYSTSPTLPNSQLVQDAAYWPCCNQREESRGGIRVHATAPIWENRPDEDVAAATRMLIEIFTRARAVLASNPAPSANGA